MELTVGDVALVPTAASFEPDSPISIELVAGASVIAELHSAELVVTHLFDEVVRVGVPAGRRCVELPALGLGGYGVALAVSGDVVARTAFDVLGDTFELPRYGFAAEFDADVHASDVVMFFRRLHLNLAQFYDWGYRHSELLPPQNEYHDPLGQRRDLGVVNELAAALDAAGVVPLGYSAVYAISNAEADDWRDELLLRADGEPYRLGEDFLTLVDPGAPRWLGHYRAMLARALRGTALRGFHLDQYGWPKRAVRGDGAVVALDRSYEAMIRAVREALPDGRLVFNNVNDFGTAQTAGAPQDASYIEVWPPHDTLGDLGDLANRTRSLRPQHPPILAAYLSCYAREPRERADAAARLVMATAFSHGATHLLLGEAGKALIDPYYPRNHTLTEDSIEMFATWYDTAVRWGELLFDPTAQDVTGFMTGGINSDIVFGGGGATFSTKPQAGTIWTRVVRTARGLLVHLINLADQDEVAWDAGKEPSSARSDITLRIAPVDGQETLHWIEPGAEPVLLRPGGSIPAFAADSLSASQTTLEFALPPLRDWAFVFLSATGGIGAR